MGGESIKPIRKRIHVYFLMTTYYNQLLSYLKLRLKENFSYVHFITLHTHQMRFRTQIYLIYVSNKKTKRTNKKIQDIKKIRLKTTQNLKCKKITFIFLKLRFG